MFAARETCRFLVLYMDLNTGLIPSLFRGTKKSGASFSNAFRLDVSLPPTAQAVRMIHLSVQTFCLARPAALDLRCLQHFTPTERTNE